MVSAILSRIVILLFGTLYPAYASYKAVRTKNVKEYVKWMMYWIVFALFCSIETFSDVFLSWLPFYYELKIVFVLWMLSPMTQGSSFLFKKFVHPQLARREKEIDEMIAQASRQGYTTLLSFGSKSITYASQFMMRTAIMGQSRLVDHLRRSYSTSDLSNDGHGLLPRHDASGEEEGEDELDNRLREDNAELQVRSGKSKLNRSKSSAGTTTAGYSLSSLKEETEGDGEEEEEKIITETYTLQDSAKRQYTLKEDNRAGQHSSRCQSLPPFSGLNKRVAGPFIQKSTDLLNIKPKDNVPDKAVLISPDPKIQPKVTAPVPRIIELKRNLFSRSHSQDNIIITRGKDQVLMGLSSDRKRRLLQRAQSEGASGQKPNVIRRANSPLAHDNQHLLRRNSVGRAISPLATEDNQRRARQILIDESRKKKILEHVNLEENATLNILESHEPLDSVSPDVRQDSESLETIKSKSSSIKLSGRKESDVDVVESGKAQWQLVDENDHELIKSIESSDSELLFIDAEDGDSEDQFEDSMDLGSHGNASPLSSSLESGDSFFEVSSFMKNSPGNLSDDDILFESGISDSEDEDYIHSISDSSETLRSLTPESLEEIFLIPDTEGEFPSGGILSPYTLQSLDLVPSDRFLLESSTQSLPGSPSLSRGSWLEDIAEESHQSAPSSPYNEAKYSRLHTGSLSSTASKLRGEVKTTKGKSAIRKQVSNSSSLTFDPVRSWTTHHMPLSSAPSTTTMPSLSPSPSIRLPRDQPLQRLYTRSQSLDSRDSWFHTYPNAALAAGIVPRLQRANSAKSSSVERDDLPLHRFQKLSQDPSQMNLKAKKWS